MRLLALALTATAAFGVAGCCNVPCDPCCPPCVAVEERPSLFVNPPPRPASHPGALEPAAEPAPVVAPPPGAPGPALPVPDLPGDAPPLDQPERLESK
jgi:hypothetical protein